MAFKRKLNVSRLLTAIHWNNWQTSCLSAKNNFVSTLIATVKNLYEPAKIKHILSFN